jgi:hypothetical protein
MKAALTADSLAKLLGSLDANRDRAGERYEDLRRTLIRFFEWRGASFPEEHADEALNRVAKKLSEGVEIKNVGGYCYEVGRLVLLEALKGQDRKREPLESIRLEAALDPAAEADEKELRLRCLDDCLHALPAESSRLILEYYSYEAQGRVDLRRSLAERFGLRREALANRAQRLRDRLEYCVVNCVRNKSSI